jgi:exodeoxyribonuclease VII large subunit
MIPTAPLPTTLTVSELNRQVKRMLEVSYGLVWVSGEISGLSRPGSGHWYFTLKDAQAQVRCAMFKGFNQRLKFLPREGDEIRVLAKVSLYEGRGEFQLIVENMEPAGLGALQAAYEQLRLKLTAEGLFDPARKRALPRMPARVAVITSATGAVIHDIISVCQRRFPLLEINLLPVSVQGEHARHEIVAAITLANRLRLGDVLIVGRGGGSLEDLWAFNEESVVRAVATSDLPVVSAVGHETDTTLADFAADYRAPTPSAAAEKITPDQFELMQSLDLTAGRLRHMMGSLLARQTQQLTHLQQRLRAPGQILQERRLRLQELSRQLERLLRQHLATRALYLERCQRLLQAHNPQRSLESRRAHLQGLLNRLGKAQSLALGNRQQTLHSCVRALHATSPLATLGRGYAVVFDAGQHVLQSAAQVNPGDCVKVRLKQGQLRCQVLESLPEDPSSKTSRA